MKFQEAQVFGTRCAVFDIKTRTEKTLFMRVDSNPRGVPVHVVWVSAARFIQAWRKATAPAWRGLTHRHLDRIRRSMGKNTAYADQMLAYKDEGGWRADYKFHHAVTGFADGRDNPVPLAEVECSDGYGLSFTNGITRTIFLLANGVECFPVETSDKSLEALVRQAAATPDSWHTFGVQARQARPPETIA